MATTEQKHCIFCEATDLSWEHLLPDSTMRRLFPRDASTKREFTRETAVSIDDVLPPPRESISVIQGSIFSVRLKIVCKEKCNNGWMSRLEEEAGPLLERLIRASPGGLTPDGQRLLATWLAKTVMVAEFTSPDDITISEADRRAMRETQKIAPGWKMWIGTTTGMEWRRRIEHISSHGITVMDSAYRPPTPLGNAQVTFFGLNTFLAIVFSSSAAVINLNLEPEWGTGLRQIWPIVSPEIILPIFPVRDEEVSAALANFRKLLHPTILRFGKRPSGS